MSKATEAAIEERSEPPSRAICNDHDKLSGGCPVNLVGDGIYGDAEIASQDSGDGVIGAVYHNHVPAVEIGDVNLVGHGVDRHIVR